jgi:hypothetical protein
MKKSFEKERRKYPRLNAKFVVSYKNNPNDYDLSQTKNIGQGGVMVTTSRKFAAGTQLAITVTFPFVPQRIEILGTVVSSKEIAKNLLYETRVAFSDLNKKFFQELGDFIQERLGN